MELHYCSCFPNPLLIYFFRLLQNPSTSFILEIYLLNSLLLWGFNRFFCFLLWDILFALIWTHHIDCFSCHQLGSLVKFVPIQYNWSWVLRDCQISLNYMVYQSQEPLLIIDFHFFNIRKFLVVHGQISPLHFYYRIMALFDYFLFE